MKNKNENEIDTTNMPPLTAAELAEIPKWANWALLQSYYTRQAQGKKFPDEKRAELTELIVERFAQLTNETYWKDLKEKTAAQHVFIVTTNGGTWGKGKTIEEAAKNAKGRAADRAYVTMVLNSPVEEVWVDGMGRANSDAPGSMFVTVGKTTIGGILSANK